MALIKCPECGKEVSDSALTCPHCGFQLKEPKKIVKNQKSKPKKKNNGCLTLLIIIAILIAIIYIFGSSGNNSSPSTNDSSTNKFLAYNYAEKFVKDKLKSPSTAKFPSLLEKDKQVTNLGENKYKIVSWVDSQNGFGAMIRTHFSCIIIFEGNTVKCEQLKFDN